MSGNSYQRIDRNAQETGQIKDWCRVILQNNVCVWGEICKIWHPEPARDRNSKAKQNGDQICHSVIACKNDQIKGDCENLRHKWGQRDSPQVAIFSVLWNDSRLVIDQFWDKIDDGSMEKAIHHIDKEYTTIQTSIFLTNIVESGL